MNRTTVAATMLTLALAACALETTEEQQHRERDRLLSWCDQNPGACEVRAPLDEPEPLAYPEDCIASRCREKGLICLYELPICEPQSRLCVQRYRSKLASCMHGVWDCHRFCWNGTYENEWVTP